MEHSSEVSCQAHRSDPFDCILDPNDCWPFQYGVKFPERIPILEETCRSALATSLRKSVEPIFGEETEAPKSGKTRRRYKLNRIPDVYQVRTSYCYLPKTMASTLSRFGQKYSKKAPFSPGFLLHPFLSFPLFTRCLIITAIVTKFSLNYPH